MKGYNNHEISISLEQGYQSYIILNAFAFLQHYLKKYSYNQENECSPRKIFRINLG
jgi:hypothetical protein